jgi:hypothetical protein
MQKVIVYQSEAEASRDYWMWEQDGWIYLFGVITICFVLAFSWAWVIGGGPRRLWWFIRGVDSQDYRTLCSRCGRTGQAHWSPLKCLRFKR